MRRWTIKELKEISDINFAIAILYERKSTLTNPYSPMNDRINKAIRGLEDLKTKHNL